MGEVQLGRWHGASGEEQNVGEWSVLCLANLALWTAGCGRPTLNCIGRFWLESVRSASKLNSKCTQMNYEVNFITMHKCTEMYSNVLQTARVHWRVPVLFEIKIKRLLEVRYLRLLPRRVNFQWLPKIEHSADVPVESPHDNTQSRLALPYSSSQNTLCARGPRQDSLKMES